VIKDYSRISLGIVPNALLFAIVFTVYPIESAQAQSLTVPDAPTGLTATAVSTSQINLSWSAPSNDGGSWITGYKIERQINSGPWITLITNTGPSTAYSDSGLTPDTTYTYRVSAINGAYGLHFAMYMDPGDGNSLSTPWQRVYDAQAAYPDVSIMINANPSNGVGSSPRSDFEYSIAALRSEGVTVLGYVSTDYNGGPKTDASIKAEIDNWVSWYGDGALGAGLGINGIFLDEMENNIGTGVNGDNVQWYTDLTDYIKNTKGLSHTAGNPGTNIDEAYFGSVDQIKIHESPGLPILDYLFNDWKLNYPISTFSMTPYQVPTLDEDFVMEAQQYVTHIYIQNNGVDGNPWDTLSTHFERIVELSAEANINSVNTSIPSIEASATPTPYTLTINSVDLTGNLTTGYYATVHEGETLIQTGFTPVTFTGTAGTTYTVGVQDYAGVNFHHWEDGSTVAARDVTLISDTTVVAYYINTNGDVTAPIVSANPIGGTFFNSVDVTMSATDDVDPTPNIYYTIDGSTPTTNSSTIYTSPITITANTTFGFIAEDAAGNISPVSTEDYVIVVDVNAPVVSANPIGGTFFNSVDVMMSATDDVDPTPNIYYTIDGSSPTTASLVYTSPITITANTTFGFIAEDAAGNISPVSTEDYVITPAYTLTINSVDLTGNLTTGYYATVHEGETLIQTGFTPVTFTGTAGTTYTVGVQDYAGVNFHHWEDGSTVAARDVTLISDTTVVAYYINTNGDVTAPIVSANPIGGTFFNSVDVTMSATDDVDPTPNIYYTIDGSTPTTNSSTIYTSPITITANTTFGFIAEDAAGNISPVSTEDYVIVVDVNAPVVSANPIGGTFFNSVDVMMSATDDVDPTPNIYYTIDGSSPTTASLVYTSPITITANTTFGFIAEDAAGNISPVSTEDYVITPAYTLTINSIDLTGNLTTGYYATIYEGVTLLQTGFTPVTFTGTAGTTYTVETQDYIPFLFKNWEDGSTVAARDITLISDITVSASYIDATGDVTKPIVSASSTGGTYVDPVDVILTATDDIDPTPNIFFTMDGSTPTIASPLYTVPIPITAATTLNFIVVDASGNTSAVSTEVYVFVIDVTEPVVSANPIGGTFFNSVNVTLNATDAFDPAPTTYYTINGSSPTTASPVYIGPITITANTTLGFIAEDAAGNISPVSTENYVITP
jgi:hypothetical protein